MDRPGFPENKITMHTLVLWPAVLRGVLCTIQSQCSIVSSKLRCETSRPYKLRWDRFWHVPHIAVSPSSTIDSFAYHRPSISLSYYRHRVKHRLGRRLTGGHCRCSGKEYIIICCGETEGFCVVTALRYAEVVLPWGLPLSRIRDKTQQTAWQLAIYKPSSRRL